MSKRDNGVVYWGSSTWANIFKRGFWLIGREATSPLWRHQKEIFFHVTGPLCGEFTGHRWIPLTKASDAELWCFLWSVPEQSVLVNSQDASDMRRHRAHYDVTVMKLESILENLCEICATHSFGLVPICKVDMFVHISQCCRRLSHLDSHVWDIHLSVSKLTLSNIRKIDPYKNKNKIN